jgi:hypothetical protein
LQNLGLQRCLKRAFPKTRHCTTSPMFSEPNVGEFLHGLHLNFALHDQSLIRVRRLGWDAKLCCRPTETCLHCIGNHQTSNLSKFAIQNNMCSGGNWLRPSQNSVSTPVRWVCNRHGNLIHSGLQPSGMLCIFITSHGNHKLKHLELLCRAQCKLQALICRELGCWDHGDARIHSKWLVAQISSTW